MPVRLNGSTSGYTELSAPAVAGNNTLTLPTGNGSNGQFLQGNGSGALSWSGSLTLGTAKSSTSGTSIDFSPADGTGIPSWAKRVTVMFNQVSTTGSSPIGIQLGTSSGIDSTSTYNGSASYGSGGATITYNTTSFLIEAGGSTTAATIGSGISMICSFGSNTWIESGTFAPYAASTNAPSYSAGQKTLSGTLDRIRITTVNGTDTFDAGSINILYEG